MRIGVPKEIKNQEYRVGLTPESVEELTRRGHEIWVEASAGIGIGASDHDYQNSGATIAADAADVFDKSEMIVKVKEPQAEERAKLRDDHLLFTYLHLAPDAAQKHQHETKKSTKTSHTLVTHCRWLTLYWRFIFV